MKMYEDYDSCRDHANKYLEAQDNALIPYLLSNEYYSDDCGANNLDYMREFQESYHGIDSTASSKQLIFKTETEEDSETWKDKEPTMWSSADVLHWVASVAESHKFPYELVNATAFNIDGKTLLSLSKRDFLSLDEKYGLALYNALHKSLPEFADVQTLFHPQLSCKQEAKLETLSSPAKMAGVLLPLVSNSLKQAEPYGLVATSDGFHNDITNSSESYPFELEPISAEGGNGCRSAAGAGFISTININNNSNSNLDSVGSSGSSERKNSTDNSLCSDTEHSDLEVKKKNKKSGKRPPGRPPGVRASKEKPEKKTGRLWEFIRDLLLDPQHCPSVICWENHDDGVFRFVKSEKVAKIWGDRKGNEKMNYEKLSRAMRYYYRSKVLQPVIGRRLVYKFGPTARGWKTENPNFRH